MTRRKRVSRAWHLAAFLSVLVLCQLSPTSAATQSEWTGSYGAAYLKIPVGPALMSVPDVLAGMDPDASLAFSNPAGLSRLSYGSVFFSRAAWLDELSLNAASVVLPVTRYDMGFSFGTRLLQGGEVLGYDSNNQVVSEDTYYGLVFSGALAKRFRSVGLSLGGGVNYLREHLPGETGDGFSFSAGASYEKGAHRVDVFAQDVGGTISFEGREYPLDSRFVAGYGYGFNRSWGRLDLGAQLAVLRSDAKRLQFGAVYHFPRFFVLRGGLERPFDAPEGAQLPLSAGFGVRYGTFMLDYAFTPQEYFENTHTFSIGVSFGTHGAVRNISADAMRAADAQGSSLQAANPATPRGPQNAPAGTTAQAVPAGRPAQAAAARPSKSNETKTFVIVAGMHTRAESARAEARALQLVKVPAVVEGHGSEFRVVIGRYENREAANKALARYESQGHRFEIRPETQ